MGTAKSNHWYIQWMSCFDMVTEFPTASSTISIYCFLKFDLFTLHPKTISIYYSCECRRRTIHSLVNCLFVCFYSRFTFCKSKSCLSSYLSSLSAIEYGWSVQWWCNFERNRRIPQGWKFSPNVRATKWSSSM